MILDLLSLPIMLNYFFFFSNKFIENFMKNMNNCPGADISKKYNFPTSVLLRISNYLDS